MSSGIVAPTSILAFINIPKIEDGVLYIFIPACKGERDKNK